MIGLGCALLARVEYVSPIILTGSPDGNAP